MAKSWLIVFLGQKFTSFFNTKIANQKIIMMAANKLCGNDIEYKQ